MYCIKNIVLYIIFVYINLAEMYKITIWLEVHLKLKTKTKMFCKCKNEQNFDSLLPNTNICPVCTAQPGALPILTEDCLWKSLLIWKALNCTINKESSFDRKNYFYPDLPMGYQITQFYKPVNVDWELNFFLNNYQEQSKVAIVDAHMECDTAKMIHSDQDSLIDFNRATTPLIEIVTWPNFHTEDEVVEFLKELQRIAKYNDISDADLEKWQMRVDVNISISKDEMLWTRVELKNINSFGMIKRAIKNEYQRQVSILESGDSLEMQTRGRDDMKWESYLMRSKETALDYRYFPEPDMPTLRLDEEILAKLDSAELIIPHNIIKQFKEEYGFHKEYINSLISDKAVLKYFFDCVEDWVDPKIIAKWISWPINAYMKDNFVWINDLKFDRKEFINFLNITAEWKIIDNQMKLVMEEMLHTWRSAKEIITDKWFDSPAIDSEKLETLLKEILDNNPKIVQQYKEWKETVIWFFVGQVMKETQWKANPNEIKKIFLELIKKY